MIRTLVRRRPVIRPRLESLENRELLTLTATGQSLFGVEGTSLTAEVATFTDTDTTLASTDLSASINWGDGTTTSGTVASVSGTNYEVDGTHTYATYSLSSPYAVTVTIVDSKNTLTAIANSTASISNAPLYAGNPVVPGTPVQFTGVGPTAAAAAIGNFRTAIGGADNGSTASPQTTGSRTINWDDVTLAGTGADAPPATTVISQGNTVAIAPNRYLNRGAVLDSSDAVSSNGFITVNANAANLFPAFSTANVVAPFNGNTMSLTFVAPAAVGTTPTAAATRGFGAVFLNVQEAGSTTIEYFDGARSLGSISAPAGAVGQPEFVGELFANAIVTRVEITLGTDAIFDFNGVTFAAGTALDKPTMGHNLVAADDFVYAEPVPIANAGTILNGAAGTSTAAAIPVTVGSTFTGTIASFSSGAPAASPKNFTAVINWGDGHSTIGTVGLNSLGGFDVTGSNLYAATGNYPVTTTVTDFGGSTVVVTNTVSVSKIGTSVVVASLANPVQSSQSLTLAASVFQASATASPSTGTVTFFDGSTSLGVATLSAGGTASLTTTTLAPGSHSITAQYSGDATFSTSTSAAITQVVNPNVTSLIGIVRGGFKIRRGFVQRVTIKNLSSSAIVGPIDLVLDNLASGVVLTSAVGTTTTTTPAGSPYVLFPVGASGSLAPGQTTFVDLTFSAKRPRLILYTPRILAGLSQP